MSPSSTRMLCIMLLCSLLCAVLAEKLVPDGLMTLGERRELREEAREMFYHAYNAYMEHAYPADELMPLSCKGRFRGITPSRGDMDDVLGNFSMTLVDSLDTLVLLGDIKEFERAVKLVIRDISFDNDIIVSVFETNIRMIGGLLSAHILAEHVRVTSDALMWYNGELLALARDLGYKLLPAFNTSTGIPHARVNLRTGMADDRLRLSHETCTACAGTILLEFAALSRLTGEPIFELRAHAAMDALWKLRHRSSDLMGTVLNVHSGDWVRRDSGVGAGIDSYYEYLFKSYVLLGDNKYLVRFNRHYHAVMKYISEGPMLTDVLMHRPHAKSRNFMDSLLAFWPGLQVLSGDLKPAVQTHEMLYQIIQKHTFLPEAFTTDFQVHWAQHPLRPEFIESTYFLYRATGDHHYLNVGKQALKSLQQHAKVPCGYAAVNDVRTGKHEDRMDSFVLSETIKYLYLLFSDPKDLVVDIDEFVFTTEAHLLPLSLAHLGNHTFTSSRHTSESYVQEFMRTCPSSDKLFPERVRLPLRNYITGSCPRSPTTVSELSAASFQANNMDHLRTVFNMGITMISLGDGKVRLTHSFNNAKDGVAGTLGARFMEEIVELTKVQSINMLSQLQAVAFPNSLDAEDSPSQWQALPAGPSHFSANVAGDQYVEAVVFNGISHYFCNEKTSSGLSEELRNKILVAKRGACTFVEKARVAQALGVVAVIICDNEATNSDDQPMFSMSGDGTNDVKISAVFLYGRECKVLIDAVQQRPELPVRIMSMAGFEQLRKAPNKRAGSHAQLDQSNETATTSTTFDNDNGQEQPKSSSKPGQEL